jgi:peptidyl-prolyl cis-trans isomerase SurA
MLKPTDMTKMALKTLAALLIICCSATFISAQTLFTYGNQSVSREEYLKAFGKNNGDKTATQQAYNDYLELYLRYKLKVKAAYDLKLDTLSSQAAEMKNFRNQIVENYMNDDVSLNRIVNEAFDRSQKDLHIAHLFIRVPKNASPADTLLAYRRVSEAYTDLKNGKSFGEVAANYSDDTAAKTNQGDIGFITVFSLPYDLETLAYTTPAGQFSAPFRSRAGYHIFKNIEERKAIGRIKTAQILFLFPPNATEEIKTAIKQRADSIYGLLVNGANFAELAKKYSGDNLSYQTGGEMGEYGVGKFSGVFEKAAYGLEKDGDISKPVLTAFGYHIIKRLERKPVPEINNKETFTAYKQKVLTDARNENAKKAMLQRILQETNFKLSVFNMNNLSVYTDSFLQHKILPKFPGIDEKTILFTFTKKNITIKDWLDYVSSTKNLKRTNDAKTNKELLDQFLQVSAFENYRNHLETYNKDFAYQLKEFREGNLLFEIMQRKIWDRASADSAGLKKYFESHKNKYWWEPSADAVAFTASNESAASGIQKKIEAEGIEHWKKIVDSSGGSAQADSGRFELNQLPMAEKNGFNPGEFTSLTGNKNDNTVTFAYLIKVYRERLPRDYTDARGYIINDYQAFLEDSWIAELKKKYPVKINEEVLKNLPK